MPDFLNFTRQAQVKLQPTTRNLPLRFAFTQCSSETVNDGSIPYGETISSAVVKAYSPSGSDVTTSMVTQGAAVDGLNVSCEISWYTGVADGLHKLTVILTMLSGYIDEFDCQRILVVNT